MILLQTKSLQLTYFYANTLLIRQLLFCFTAALQFNNRKLVGLTSAKTVVQESGQLLSCARMGLDWTWLVGPGHQPLLLSPPFASYGFVCELFLQDF